MIVEDDNILGIGYRDIKEIVAGAKATLRGVKNKSSPPVSFCRSDKQKLKDLTRR